MVINYHLVTKFSTFKQVTDSNSQLLNRLQMVADSIETVILTFVFILLHIKRIKMVITVYVCLCFTVPWFSLGNLWGKNLYKKSFPRMVREQDQYRFMGFGGMRITFTVYRTGHLNCSCLCMKEIFALSTLFNLME